MDIIYHLINVHNVINIVLVALKEMRNLVKDVKKVISYMDLFVLKLVQMDTMVMLHKVTHPFVHYVIHIAQNVPVLNTLIVKDAKRDIT